MSPFRVIGRRVRRRFVALCVLCGSPGRPFAGALRAPARSPLRACRVRGCVRPLLWVLWFWTLRPLRPLRFDCGRRETGDGRRECRELPRSGPGYGHGDGLPRWRAAKRKAPTATSVLGRGRRKTRRHCGRTCGTLTRSRRTARRSPFPLVCPAVPCPGLRRSDNGSACPPRWSRSDFTRSGQKDRGPRFTSEAWPASFDVQSVAPQQGD